MTTTPAATVPVPLAPEALGREPDVVEGLRLVHALLDELGPALRAASGRVEVEAKGDGTPVTEIDRSTDERLTVAITERFPHHAVVSEERATVAEGTSWTWVIDPIDGTSNFVSGLPWWGVSVALCHEGLPVLGVVDAPALGHRWVATRGAGTERDGRRVHVRQGVDWHDRTQVHQPVMLTSGAARRLAGSRLALNARLAGAVALDVAAVADGSASASVSWVPHVWDVAAAVLLVQEAGGAAVQGAARPLLPLEAGVDHARRVELTATAPDHRTVAELVERTLAHDPSTGPA